MPARKSELFLHFQKDQLAVLSRLDSPKKIQDFLDYEIAYNNEISGDTCLSPLSVLAQKRAHCIEGAMLAAAAFMFHNKPGLLLDLRANNRDDDHVIAPFVENGRWGAVAQSHFCGLRYREPIYSSFAELAKSYFEFYYNDRAEKTLREYSVPLDAATLQKDWVDSKGDVFFVSERLDEIRHYNILPQKCKALRKADSRLFLSEIFGSGSIPLTKQHSSLDVYKKIRKK